jgi:hypothetical protein
VFICAEQLGISLWLIVWRWGAEKKLYLEVGNGVGDGEPGSPGVLLITKWAIESLGNSTEVEGADSRSGNAVSERQEVTECCPAWRLPTSSEPQPHLRPILPS